MKDALEPQEKIYGLKCIAAELGRSEKYVRRMSSAKLLRRLPLRKDHMGIYITRWRLENWRHEQDAPWAPDVKQTGATG